MPKFIPRQRKRRVLDRQREATSHTDNSGTVELIPKTKDEKEQRRQKLREQLKAQQPPSKLSRNKQKRLDKYIENKLKKDEKQELLRKLEAHRFDTSLLRSTKDLGQRTESKRQVLQRALVEKAAGINVVEADKILFERRELQEQLDEENDSDQSPEPKLLQQSRQQNLQFGSGLKRPLDLDESGLPIIAKRAKKNSSSSKFKVSIMPQTADVSDWEGFSDEDQEETSKASAESDSVNEEGSEEGSEEEEISNSSGEDDDESREEDDDDHESDDENFSESSEDKPKIKSKERMSAFRAWAESQRNEALDFKPSNVIDEQQTSQVPINHTPHPVELDPLPFELEIKENTDRKTHAVAVVRNDEVQEARLKLPVVAKEQEIMEAIFSHDTVIVSGATGSGKTTQIPQFLFENGFGDQNGPTPGMIGITQPRRVAAVSMAKRVGEELGSAKGRVAHQIRFDSTVGRNTAIKFMTDGVLLREMSDDFALRKYSIVIIDEAHERTVNTDILISLMSRCVQVRRELARDKPMEFKPLKLVIMSATLRVEDFRQNSKLFKIPPPLVQAEGRQFEVTPHWARKTTHDFIDEACKRIIRGHKQLPAGGMLVFLTGQQDIRILAQKLKDVVPYTGGTSLSPLEPPAYSSDMAVEAEDLDYVLNKYKKLETTQDDFDDSDLEIDGLDDNGEYDEEFKIENEEPAALHKIHVLPLYSQLPSKDQMKVFEAVPDDSRLIVLATNVAETSLTIPGIRYVFDSGRVKERKWDQAGVQTFETTWISKASADQRMGRAGRTGPGHCYRLYSSAIYETFNDFSEPEIYRSPLEGVVLQLKAFNIPRVENFPFVTAPNRVNLVKAESLLCHLGALGSNRRITDLGRELHEYPLGPRFAQILRLGVKYGCANHAIALVAALDVPELLIPQATLELNGSERPSETEHQKKLYGQAQGHLSRLSQVSDAMKLLGAMITYSKADDAEDICSQYFIRLKACEEATHLREQLRNIVNTVHGMHTQVPSEVVVTDPSEKTVNVLKQIVAAGFVDQVAIRADLLPYATPPAEKPRRAIDVRYQTLMPSYDSASVISENDKYVFLHPSSLLARRSLAKLPAYIIYHRLQRSQSSINGKTPKTRMHPLTPIHGDQLSSLLKDSSLLEVSKPKGRITVLPSEKGKDRRQCIVELSIVGKKGDLGWTLAQKEVVQRRELKEGWVVEKFLN
jgi:ATP-dependent RNA helicase DHX37/DHR1